MKTPSIDIEFMKYFIQLEETQKKTLLNFLKTLVVKKDTKEPISLEAYNKELEQADAEVENGDFVSHEAVMKRYLNI